MPFLGRRFLVATIAAAFCLGSAAAAPITIEFSGVIRWVDDRGNLLNGAVAAGGAFSGSYTYESTTPDGNVISTVGDYWHYSSPYGITVQAGGLTFATDPADVMFLVELCDNHGTPSSDNYLLRSYNNLDLSDGLSVDHISWQLDDAGGTALSSADLPLGAPILGDWPGDQFYALTITGGTGGDFPLYGEDYFIRADIMSATVASPNAVPEPSTGLTLLAGLAVVAAGMRRKKARQ